MKVSADTLELKHLELDGVADVLAARVRAAIAGQPRGKWNRTGELLRSVAGTTTGVESAAVTVSGDRLQRDPELALKFRDEVMPANVIDGDVREAIAQAVHDAIEVKR